MPKPLFPPASRDYVLSFQFSAWYPKFAKHTIKSTILRPLPSDFKEYLAAEGVFIPEGADNGPVESTLSDDENTDQSNEDDLVPPKYHFPDLDKHIRGCIEEYGAVFPKLNFSSPKDASWLLPSSAPLKCTSPADVYMLLKSSDFINHDLLVDSVFEGCVTSEEDTSQKTEYEWELVLRKWYPMDRGREIRCFVRDNVLLGISQRDTNYYEFWNEQETRSKVITTVERCWKQNIKNVWTGQHYTFDLLLTRDLSRGHILDFNPYMTKTDPLLFTYEELRDLSEIVGLDHSLILRTIDSPSHPAASKNAPAHQHNMIPFDAIRISDGHDINEFADLWKESLKGGMNHADD